MEKKEHLRKRVYAFANLHKDMPKSEIVAHFMKENAAKSTLYAILKRKENNINAEQQTGSGRIANKMPLKSIQSLKNMIDHTHGISQRKLASKFNITQQYVCQILKEKTDIRYMKKKKVPNRTIAQQTVVRSKCRHLVNLFRGKIVILDDESYFRLSNNDLAANSGFYTSNIDKTPSKIKLKRIRKFEPKLLVWIAFSEKGLSQHYIVPSGQAINTKCYITKCMSKLKRFITQLHKNDEIVFWPDLASSHYSKETTEFLKSNNINFVPKHCNPANVPELRPIEDFWSELKRHVYDKGWCAKNLDQLRRRIEYSLKKLSHEHVLHLSKSTFTRVDAVRRRGMINV